MARLFRDCPQAVAETTGFLSRIGFTLDDLRYEYPHEPVPEGWEPQSWLEHIVTQAARARYGAELHHKVKRMLDGEFHLIPRQNNACYFLNQTTLLVFARQI